MNRLQFESGYMFGLGMWLAQQECDVLEAEANVKLNTKDEDVEYLKNREHEEKAKLANLRLHIDRKFQDAVGK